MPSGHYERKPRWPLEQRFWRKVSRQGKLMDSNLGPCWDWTASKNQDGYGRMYAGPGHKPKLVSAHIISWQIHYGSIPSGMNVCHRCDNPACTRPDHLFLGTRKQNMEDSARKGRMHIGEASGNTHLTGKQVLEIRKLHASEGYSERKLARVYGVTGPTIGSILRRRTWKHI